MTFHVPIPVAPVDFADSPAMSPFGRVATSQATAIFTNQQQYGDDTRVWETAFGGTGTTVFLPNEATIQLSTGGNAASASVVRQSRVYHRYTPGHGQSVAMTFVMDGGAVFTGNTRRVGYFDANNGVFLEVADGLVSFCIRSNTTGTPVTTRVAQGDWNVDTFGASNAPGAPNPSGYVIDWSTAQIMVLDLQWLGVGRVRVGFDIDGHIFYAHYFNNANARASVYMTTANLPLRYENFNTATASGTVTLRHICASVTAGGGAEPNFGKLLTYNNGGVGTALANGTRRPVISLRAKTTGPNGVRNTGQILLEQYDTSAVGSNPVFWELVLNPTLTGATFAAYDAANSIAEVDLAATTVAGGTILDAGYLAASAQNKSSSTQFADVKSLLLVYSGLLNTQDILTLVCSAPAGAASAFANFQWLEIF